MKYIRKVLISLFYIIFLCTIFLNIKVFAYDLNNETNSKSIIQEISENLFGNLSVKSVEYLYNLDDSPDYVYATFENCGYAVYSSDTLDLLEYSLEGNLPYPSGNKKYYSGPTQYINRTEGTYKNISTGEVLTETDVNLLIEQSKISLLSAETEKGKTRKNLNLNIFYEGNLEEDNAFSLYNNEEESSSNGGGNQIQAG